MLSNNDFKNFISCYHSIIGLENKNILSCIPDSKKYEFTNRVKEILDKRIENALGFIPDYMKNQPHDYAINQKDDKTYLSFDFGNLIIDYMYHNLLSSNVTKAHVSSALKPAILKMCGAYCHHRDEEFKDSIKNCFQKIKKSLNDSLNDISTFENSVEREKIKNKLLDERKELVKIMQNMDSLTVAYNVDLTDIFAEYIDQDKFLLYLGYINVLNIENETKDIDESIIFLNRYLTYIRYKINLDKDYNPSIWFYYGEGRKEKISLLRILEHIKEFLPNITVPKTEEDFLLLLEILPDLNKKIKIEKFKKGIELSWEFLPVSIDVYEREKISKRTKKSEEEQIKILAKRQKTLEGKLEIFSYIPYIAQLKGINHFEGYIAFVLENGKVILEKFYKKTKLGLIPVINEAVYVMDIQSFAVLSKKTKLEVRQTAKEEKNIKVIYHTSKFREKILNEVEDISYNKEVINYIEELVASSKVSKEKGK